jgi:DNA-binding response OmpR family regulator
MVSAVDGSGRTMRVLIVEDHEHVAALMQRLLHQNGFVVDAVGSVEEATAALAVAHYDALILDLSLPDGDGADLLRQLRRAGQGVPVLVATAREGLRERVGLLNDGADDYLVKPFSLEELLARLRALLRRAPQPSATLLEFGNIALDVDAQSVSIAGEPVEMSRREFAVLGALMRNQGRLLPREQLEEAVYSLDDEVTPNAIEVAVSRLRRRLEAHGANGSIVAMRGLGYTLSEAAEC